MSILLVVLKNKLDHYTSSDFLYKLSHRFSKKFSPLIIENKGKKHIQEITKFMNNYKNGKLFLTEHRVSLDSVKEIDRFVKEIQNKNKELFIYVLSNNLNLGFETPDYLFNLTNTLGLDDFIIEKIEKSSIVIEKPWKRYRVLACLLTLIATQTLIKLA